MRIFPVIALMALALASCATAPQNSPSQAAPVAAPTTYKEALPTLVKSFFANGDVAGWVQTTYDSQGRVTLRETYNGTGALLERSTGSEKGNAWRLTTINMQSGNLVDYEDLVYDAQGHVLSETFLNAKEVPQSASVYQYNKDGQRTEWIAKTGDSGIQARTEYLLDPEGHNVKTEVYDGGNNLLDVFESTYDPQGDILSTKGTDSSGNLIEKTLYTWDNGRLVKKESYVPYLRTWDYTYEGTNTEPSAITMSVRGNVTEKQVLTYTWITRTKG